MSYSSLPVEVRQIAERVCAPSCQKPCLVHLTEKQLEALRLECDGYGTMAMARRLLVGRSAVKDRLHNAHTKLIKAGLRQDGNGEWYMEEAA